MKYTNYLLNGNVVDINQIVSKNKYIKPISILGALPVVSFGVIVLSGLLPTAIAVDSMRSIKFFAIKKLHLKFNNIKFVDIQDDKPDEVIDNFVEKQKFYHQYIKTKCTNLFN